MLSSSFELPSVSQLLKELPDVTEALKNPDQYLAHIPPADDRKAETLREHIDLVNAKFAALCREHQLDPIIDRLILKWLPDFSNQEERKEAALLVKKFWILTVCCHDLGKINENFQREKMQQAEVFSSVDNGLDTKHSKLGAALYIGLCLKCLQETEVLSKKSGELLQVLPVLFSYAISCHHSPEMLSPKSYPFFEEEDRDKIAPYFEMYDLPIPPILFKDVPKKLQKLWPKIPGKDEIYWLIKLSFSLLTAADFLATSEYMRQQKIDEYGVMDQDLKNRCITSFRDSAGYNTELFQKTRQLATFPWEEVAERNTANLNKLRQKLAGTALLELRNHINQNLFYLEAPTGGGKTNISLALVAELLQQRPEKNKVFYVFPFTTLVDQTHQVIGERFGLDDTEHVRLHSKAPVVTPKDEDGKYGDDYQVYIDHLFGHYPVTLLTHIRFFDVIASSGKEVNYMLHRLANSIVVIDEMQAYPPREWSKITWYMEYLADQFNVTFVIMSATLPKIDGLFQTKKEFIPLISKEDKHRFFTNPNFASRVEFDFSYLKDEKLEAEELKEIILEESERYASSNDGKVRTVVECINKSAAGDLYQKFQNEDGFDEIHLLSGTILEPVRERIISGLKGQSGQNKVLVICTQVIEAGVDIDMDIGFKDISLLDSEEQLAGRINREAGKSGCRLFLFDHFSARQIYDSDDRYHVASKMPPEEKRHILENKDFDRLYDQVIEKSKLDDQAGALGGLKDYLDQTINQLNYQKADHDFKLIKQQNVTVFVPFSLKAGDFSEIERDLLSRLSSEFQQAKNDADLPISGETVFEVYKSLIHNQELDFMDRRIELKQMASLISKFCFSVMANSKDERKIREFIDPTIFEKYGYYYLLHWDYQVEGSGGQQVYTLEGGLNLGEELMEDSCIL